MPTSRFDPVPDSPYASCKGCDITLSSQAEANTHMHDTFEAAKAEGHTGGHRITILNPSREQRIHRELSRTLDFAIARAHEDLYELVAGEHATEAEIDKALQSFPDFAEGWSDYCAD